MFFGSRYMVPITEAKERFSRKNKFISFTVIFKYWKPRSDPLDVPQQPLKPQGYLPTGENCTVTLNHSGPKSQVSDLIFNKNIRSPTYFCL